jgi:hypothetical protein
MRHGFGIIGAVIILFFCVMGLSLLFLLPISLGIRYPSYTEKSMKFKSSRKGAPVGSPGPTGQAKLPRVFKF